MEYARGRGINIVVINIYTSVWNILHGKASNKDLTHPRISLGRLQIRPKRTLTLLLPPFPRPTSAKMGVQVSRNAVTSETNRLAGPARSSLNHRQNSTPMTVAKTANSSPPSWPARIISIVTFTKHDPLAPPSSIDRRPTQSTPPSFGLLSIGLTTDQSLLMEHSPRAWRFRYPITDWVRPNSTTKAVWPCTTRSIRGHRFRTILWSRRKTRGVLLPSL